MAKKKSSKGTKLRNAMKKGKYPSEIVGYFLESNREFVRDEWSRMHSLFDKYIREKTFMKKVNTFDGTSNESFFIDFTEDKRLTAYKKMQDILKRAASAGVISKGMASSFKVGKIIAPVVDGKIELSGLDYQHFKVKPANKSKNKTLTMTQLLEKIHQKLSAKGYLIRPFEKLKSKSNRKSKQKITYYMSLLSGAKYWMRVSMYEKQRLNQPFYSIEFMQENDLVKPYKEIFYSKSMHFDQADEKVLIQMLKRMKIKPSSISKKQYKSKETTTKVTTIHFKGKKFSITGTLNGFTRDSFVKMAEKLGGKFQNHISKDLDMLIVGEKPGKTKVAQAKKYKIEIVKFNDLMLMHNE